MEAEKRTPPLHAGSTFVEIGRVDSHSGHIAAVGRINKASGAQQVRITKYSPASGRWSFLDLALHEISGVHAALTAILDEERRR